MATHDYVIANGTGAAVRSDLNGALAAIVSQNSNASEPSPTYAYQWWADTTTGLLKIRNAANSAWVTIGTLASANLGLLPLAGGTMTGVLAVTAGTAALPGIAVSGDTNTGIYSPGADQLAISTGGTVRATVDSSGRLLVGTSSSRAATSGNEASVQIEKVGTGVTGQALSATDNRPEQYGPAISLIKSRGSALGSFTVVQNNDEIGGVSFIGTDGSKGLIGARIEAFVDGIPGANDMPGRLVFSTTADGAASPTERMRIDSTGLMTLAGPGIKFPATQVASTDPNTLDDYEEGTWTPTIIGTTTAGTATYALQNARYTKVGRVVQIEVLISWSSGNGTGNLRMGGLPFTSGGANTTPGLAIGYCSGIALTASHVLMAQVADGSTQIRFTSYPSGGGAIVEVAYDADGPGIAVGGTYSV